MIDLTPLLNVLNGLGWWGPLAGAALLWLVQRWQKNQQPQPNPAPGPNPAPAPDPLAPILPTPQPPARPLLDMLQKLLLALLAKRAQPASMYGAAPTDPIEDELIRICGDLMKRETPAK